LPPFGVVKADRIWGEGVRAHALTPNPGIYHCVFAQRTAEIPKSHQNH
jgi:hypothetical protein